MLDINENKVKKYIEKNRPSAEIRAELDIGYNYDGKSIELFERRPQWNNPSINHEYSFSKIKYVKTTKIWKLYWMRASGKWEAYQPLHSSTYLDKLLDCIDEDALGCFKG